ncbi:MAG: FAD-dependent oxidoreductase [Clostridiales bacterium]|nr:FAD-dependent oxidoreductase [Clostridiales bacterium]
MSNSYRSIFSPVRVAGHLIKNRLISAPSTIHTASAGQPYPTEKGIRFFEDRAKAGAGLITCAGVSVGGASDDGVHCSWDVFKPNHTNPLCDMVERIHMYGAKCTMELMGILPDGYTVSDGCLIMGGPPVGREIPKEAMETFKRDYINTAVQIMKCGFDGVLLHIGHSIPLAQFLSPLTNRRSDEYGGSTENRCRYPLELISGVRGAIGQNAIIEVRISGSEFSPGGIDIEEGIRIGELFQEYIDILQISAGMHTPDLATVTHPCGFLPPNPNIHLAEAFKKSGRITKCLISTIGGIGSIADADMIIKGGIADFVVAARAYIADPEWVRKGAAGCQEDVRPCVKCMRCHDSDNYEQHMLCTVNPLVGVEEAAEKIPAATKSKTVAVIGGGPAGMLAAVTAAQRGHKVTLLEKDDRLGGKLNFADHVAFKYPLAAYKNWLVSQVEKAGVAIRLNTEATPEHMAGFDAVIAALGAEPVIPPIAGAAKAKIAIDVYGRENELAEHVAIVGGGQVGVETALHLTGLGKKVTILEMQPELAPDASKTHRDELMAEIKKQAKLEIVTGARCTAIVDDGVLYVKDDTPGKINAGSIILSVGMRALTALADSFMGLTGEYAEIGDCAKVGTVEDATKTGWAAAMRL